MLSEIKNIEIILRKYQNHEAKQNSAFLESYYNTKCEVLGLSLPLQRKISKDGFSFSSQPLNEQFKIWSSVYLSSNLHEAKFQALFFVQGGMKKIDHRDVWQEVKNWVHGIDNWAHSDLLSSIYSIILEQEPELIYPELKKWNKSENLWVRRQSVVSLLYYKRNRKNFIPFEHMIVLVENLLTDEAYYVQKGVGWTLRELWQVDDQKTFDFIDKNLHLITSVAFTAAVEKVPADIKQAWKEKRKLNRIKSKK